jgi:hypothetical protein
LYGFVDSLEIKFDASTKSYDLMQPRPFLCLNDKQKTIGEYFEESDHEVVQVRELAE